MAEFALTATCLDAFGNRKVGEGDSLGFWEDLHDAVGSALPFIVRREWVDRIPFEELNLPRTRLDEFVPKPGEMWVLFCRLKAGAVSDSPIRSDGFPLILEWRKDSPDSPLLSSAFLQLAGLVRRQQGVENWGLWPAHARYGDQVDFTDPLLFADSEDALFVASAYGALAAGLFCAVSGKHPELWSFPTLQWDGTHGCVAGVIGLEDKFTVAADCGARVVTVAREQKDEAIAVLKGLKNGSASELFRRMTVYAVENAQTPALTAERIAFGAVRRARWLLRVVLSFVAAVLVMSALVGLFVWDAQRDVVEYYADKVDVNGLPKGLHNLSVSDIANRIQTYEFTYTGYDNPFIWSRERVLRRVRCLNCKGYPSAGRRNVLMGELGLGEAVDWEYSTGGKEVTLRDFVGREIGSLVYTEGTRKAVFRDSNSSKLSSFDEVLVAWIGWRGYREHIRDLLIDRDDKGFITSVRYAHLYSDDAIGLLGCGANVARVDVLGRLIDGRPTEVRFFDHWNRSICDKFGCFGYRYEYDGASFVRCEKLVPPEGSTNNAYTVFEYQGKTDRVKKLLGVVNGVTNFVQAISYNGNSRETRSLDSAGNLVPFGDVVKLANRRIDVWDDYGRDEASVYFAGDQLIASNVMVNMVENGHLAKIVAYWTDAEGKIAVDPQGVAMRTVRYDESGNVINLTRNRFDGTFFADEFFGPVSVFRKYEKIKDGLRLTETCFDANMDPVECANGWHRRINEQRGIGSDLSYTVHHYGTDGTPRVSKGLKVPGYRFETKGNNAIHYLYYLDEQNHPLCHPEMKSYGIAIVYGKNMTFRKSARLDSEGKIWPYGRGNLVAIGNEIRDREEVITYWSALIDGNLVDFVDGYAEERRVFDENRRVREVRRSKADGSPCEKTYDTILIEYDDNRQSRIERCYRKGQLEKTITKRIDSTVAFGEGEK